MIHQVDLFSFVFWKNLKTPIRYFEIKWPLLGHKKHVKFQFLEFSYLLVCIGIEKDTCGMSTVTSSSSRFLVISFDRFWQRIMYHKPDIWFVNSHSCEQKKNPISKRSNTFFSIWQQGFSFGWILDKQSKEVSSLCYLNILKPNYLRKRNWRQ